MSKKEMNVLDIFYILVKRWKAIFGIVSSVFVVSAVVSLLLPEWYRATATVLPPKRQSRTYGFSELISQLPVPSLRLGERGSPADIFVGILKGDEVANKIIDRFNLMEAYEQEYRDKTLEILRGNIEVRKTDDGLIAVSVLDTSPVTAANMANAFVHFLDKKNQELSIRMASERKEFIERQMVIHTPKLEASQVALKEFQEKHNAISVPDQAEAAIQVASRIQAELMELELKLWTFKSSMNFDHPEVRKIENSIGFRKRQLNQMKFGRRPRGSDGQFEEIGLGDFSENLFLPLADIPGVSLEYSQLGKDLIIQSAVGEFLLEEFARASIEETNTTPTVQFSDYAVPPDIKAKPKRAVIVLLSTIFSCVFMIMGVLLIEYFNVIREAEDEDSKKLEKILTELKRLKPWGEAEDKQEA